MNLDLLEQKLKKIHSELSEGTKKLEETAQNIYQKVSNQGEFDEIDEIEAKREYYSFLSEAEKEYQIKNEEYKKLISDFSINYLELCEWYRGPELPRQEIETFFDSKDDINQLYFLFIMGFMLQMGT
tara:strand:+ start:439 stop:819 length:381 start_codon:yes stop_codon:yes gene_type:complete